MTGAPIDHVDPLATDAANRRRTWGRGAAPIADGGGDGCELCRRHGHDDVNPAEGTIGVRRADGEAVRLRVCRRCARETSFRNFEPFGAGGA